jgi:hypothetical protein
MSELSLGGDLRVDRYVVDANARIFWVIERKLCERASDRRIVLFI